MFYWACGTQAEKMSKIPTGVYVEFGEKIIKQNSIISEGIAGVYFQRTFTFRDNQTIKIKVSSDFPPEVGAATGSYKIKYDKLIIDINASSTSVYEKGSFIVFDNFKWVDSTFTTVFNIDGHKFTFTGPGLILVKRLSSKKQLLKKNYYQLR